MNNAGNRRRKAKSYTASFMRQTGRYHVGSGNRLGWKSGWRSTQARQITTNAHITVIHLRLARGDVSKGEDYERKRYRAIRPRQTSAEKGKKVPLAVFVIVWRLDVEGPHICDHKWGPCGQDQELSRSEAHANDPELPLGRNYHETRQRIGDKSRQRSLMPILAKEKRTLVLTPVCSFERREHVE